MDRLGQTYLLNYNYGCCERLRTSHNTFLFFTFPLAVFTGLATVPRLSGAGFPTAEMRRSDGVRPQAHGAPRVHLTALNCKQRSFMEALYVGPSGTLLTGKWRSNKNYKN